MKPLDLILAVKLSLYENEADWTFRQLSQDLQVNISTIHKSYNNLKNSSLVIYGFINLSGLFEFIKHGVRYVFPVQLGEDQKGIKAGRSNIIFSSKIATRYEMVWESPSGECIGRSYQPLHPSLLKSWSHDSRFKDMIDLIDVLRLTDCRARDRNLAHQVLEEMILSKKYNMEKSS